MRPGPPGPHSPRYASPIDELDVATGGGIYGVTALGGDAGAGKSFLALATALLTALRGECAIYIAAEMTRDQIANRLYWLASRWSIADERVDELMDSYKLAILQANPELSYNGLLDGIADGLAGEERALLVIDSLNALLTALDGDGGYWTRFERLLSIIIEVRKASEGAFSALILSELNQDGVSKGRRLEYQSDLMLHMHQARGGRRLAKLTIAKNREPGESGSLGYFKLMPTGRYEKVQVRED